MGESLGWSIGWGGDMPVLSMIRYGIIGPLLRGTRALQAAQFSD